MFVSLQRDTKQYHYIGASRKILLFYTSFTISDTTWV